MNVVERMAEAVTRREVRTTVCDEEVDEGIRLEEQGHDTILT
jgi:hypothetical protein